MRSCWIALTLFSACCLSASTGAGEEKLLLGFEKKEMPADGLLWKGLSKGLTEQEASQGKTSFTSKHNDRYGFLAAGRGCTFYGKWRYGRVFRTLGWFNKVMPTDWSGYDVLRVDYRTDGPEVKVRLEAEDSFLPFPAAQEFAVPGNKWVTLELDLARAARERRLDLKSMAHLLLMVVEHPRGERAFASYLDNIRLAKRGAPAKLEVVKGGAFLAIEPGGRPCAKRTELGALDVARTAKAEGKVYCPVSREKPGGYPLLYVNERCIGGFGEGGIILAPGSGPMLSLDAGRTWTGMDGKGKTLRITPDHRGQHRSQAMIAGTDVFMAYCTARCGGGGARVTAKFTKAVRRGDRWVTGPESLVDVTARYCHDRFALCRAKSGRLWCAWSHLNRLHEKDIRAKWSQDSGESWLQAGENARAGERGVFHYPGTPGNYEGPYLTTFGQEVACFWRRIPEGDVVWTRATALRVKVKEVKAEGKVVLSVGSAQGIKIDCNALLEKEGKVLAALTVVKLAKESCVAVEKPGPAGKVKAGDEVTVMTWTPTGVISKGGNRQRTHNPRPHSAATDSKGAAYLGITAPRKGGSPKVLRCSPEEEKWVEDSPPGLAGNPMLSAWGEKMACLWFAGGAIHLSVKPSGGKWGQARKIAEEQEGVNTLAVPQVAPEKFLPVAWGTRTRRAVKVVAVPAGK